MELSSMDSLDALPRQPRYSCPQQGCGAVFTREWRLREHGTAHSGERPLVCDAPDCGARFSRSAHLRRHRLRHCGQRAFRCTHVGCSQAFFTRDNLTRHVRCVHGAEDGCFKCQYQGCDKSFKKRRTYKMHLNEHSPTLSFRCQKDGCGMRFETRAARRAHEKRHGGYACKAIGCQIVMPTWGKLQKHMVKHPAVHTCQQCKKEFKKLDSLRRHKRSHAQQKPVLLCPSEGCKAYFTTTFNLQHHIRKVHLQLFKYHCYYPDCPKVFAMRESLTRHVAHHDLDGNVKLKHRRPSKKWQKRLGGSSGHKAPLVEDDLRRLFALRLRFPGRGKVEADLSGLFNERKIPRRVETEVSLRELFDLKPARRVSTAS
ncbi:P43 5S RNA-binding protein-like [Amia ocellicauda]|uniref:P43 5S RNA-binding protein-like n=1 Tax=Amia ocellicauda TaxID=2972642 RepID=UPI003463DD7E